MWFYDCLNGAWLALSSITSIPGKKSYLNGSMHGAGRGEDGAGVGGHLQLHLFLNHFDPMMIIIPTGRRHRRIRCRGGG